MKISDIIAKLLEIKEAEGDLPILMTSTDGHYTNLIAYNFFTDEKGIRSLCLECEDTQRYQRLKDLDRLDMLHISPDKFIRGKS